MHARSHVHREGGMLWTHPSGTVSSKETVLSFLGHGVLLQQLKKKTMTSTNLSLSWPVFFLLDMYSITFQYSVHC